MARRTAALDRPALDDACCSITILENLMSRMQCTLCETTASAGDRAARQGL
jgi:hypothetical protein